MFDHSASPFVYRNPIHNAASFALIHIYGSFLSSSSRADLWSPFPWYLHQKWFPSPLSGTLAHCLMWKVNNVVFLYFVFSVVMLLFVLPLMRMMSVRMRMKIRMKMRLKIRMKMRLKNRMRIMTTLVVALPLPLLFLFIDIIPYIIIFFAILTDLKKEEITHTIFF